MAHDSAIYGQRSPRHSEQHEYLPSEYSSSPLPAKRPYTPPTSHPVQGFSYSDPEEYEMQHNQDYYEHPIVYHNKHYRTPPQPISKGGIQTRSGRSLGTPRTSSSPSSRASASLRPRKSRRGKDKQLEYKITEPLSFMTKDYDVPVEDMEAWVNRSSQARWDEVQGKHKNKIPRPMNSFMLYRRAYKERIKKWGARGDNNQLISSVAGISWNLEPPEVKDFYARVAIIERDNHSAAFPDYKFAPNKNPKKRDRDEDDSDGEWDGGSSYSSKRMRGRHDRDVTRSRSITPAPPVYPHSYPHPSSFQASNPHMMAPISYEQWTQPVTYIPGYGYDQMLQYHRQLAPIQYIPSAFPSHQENCASQLVGLPPTAGPGYDPDVTGALEFAMDPGLAGVSASYEYGTYSHGQAQHERRSQAVYEGDPEAGIHPGLQTLVPADHVWSPTEAVHAGGAFDAELDRWNGNA